MPLNITDIKHKQQYDVISDLVQIKLYLKRLLDGRALLSATVSGDEKVYNSVMISIDNEKEKILIDQLHPEDGHAKLLDKGKLTLFAGLDGIDLSFLCLLSDVDEKEGIPFYSLSFPQHIKHYQRRSSYRVQIIRSLSIPIDFKCESGETFKGEMDNISSGGMRVRLAEKIPDVVEKGMIIPQVEMDLPEEGFMVCAVEVRHVVHGERGNLHYLGLEFEGLNALDQRTINRFVTSLERELRRRSPS